MKGIFNDDLQDGAKELLKAKTKEIKFKVLENKFYFGLTVTLLLVLTIVGIWAVVTSCNGLIEFMNYLR